MSDIAATKFYVRFRESFPETEMQDAARRGFWTLNVETQPYYWVDDIGDMEDLGPTVGVAGYIGDVWAALRKLGRPIPPALDYPPELDYDAAGHRFLGRQVRKTTLGCVRAMTSHIFVKPVEQKAFTGFVWRADAESRRRIVTEDDDREVWTSPVVEFLSEWRVFVLFRTIVGVRQYKGEWWHAPDREIVEDAVTRMGKRLHAYCLDFGLTACGRTMLIEANEGYAFGHYGLPAVTYAKMLSARWRQLVEG